MILEPQTYTEREVAILMGVSRDTIRRTALRGGLEYIQLGERRFYARSYIDALLQPTEAIADLLGG